MRWGEKGYSEPHKSVQSFRVVSAHPCSNRALFEVLGWVPPLSALGRESRCSFNSGSPSISSVFCICIPNKQEIVFICMQMALSPRLGFWIKSFTVPFIPNYTQALTWAPLPGRGVSYLPSKRISVSLGCLVCHLRNRVRIESGPLICRLIVCTTLQSPLNYLTKLCRFLGVIDIRGYCERQTCGGLGVVDWQVVRTWWMRGCGEGRPACRL